MRAIKALAVAGAGVAGLAALAACTHQQGPLGLNPGYRFGYDDKGSSAALAYGLPNSDDLALMLDCPKGTGRIELSDSARGGTSAAIVLSAGGRRTSVPVHASGIEDGSNDPQVLVGRLSSRAEALQAFRRTGVLEVSHGASRYVITVAADGKAGVERFFRECG
jgi:hypothetical protein